jgi:hypothetical protein
VAVLVGLISLGVAAGCGDDDAGSQSSGGGTAADTAAAPTTGADPGTQATGSGGGGGLSGCPLTDEQVSAILGAPVVGQDVGVGCEWYPVDAAELFPNAGWNQQSEVAFSPEGLEIGLYAEQVSGVGDQAYVADVADGSWLLVRAGGLIFEVRVDTLDPTTSRAAATELANQLIAAA